MPRDGRKRLQEAAADVLSTKANKPNPIPALVGAYVDGRKTLKVAGQEDFLWVRLRGSNSEVARAFNGEQGVAPHWDLPVMVYRDDLNPGVWRILAREFRTYPGWDAVNYVPDHGLQHSFGATGSIGADPVWVFKRQMMPLLPRPTFPTGSMAIFIEPDFYSYGGQYQYWPGGETADLSAYKPSGSMSGRFVTVYIEALTNSLGYIAGDEMLVLSPPIDPSEHIALPDLTHALPVAATWLTTGSSRIGWYEIYDLRFVAEATPTGTFGPLLVLDEGVLLGPTLAMDFTGGGVTASISGSYADVYVPEGMSLFLEGNAVPVTSVSTSGILVENFVGPTIDVSVSGSVATINIVPESWGRASAAASAHGAWDDEFEDESIDGSWQKVQRGTDSNAFLEKYGRMFYQHTDQAGGSTDLHVLLKAKTISIGDYVEAAWEFSRFTDYLAPCLIFSDGVTFGAGSQVIAWTHRASAGLIRWKLDRWDNFSSESAGGTDFDFEVHTNLAFVRLKYEAANTWGVYLSFDGIEWRALQTNFARTLTPTYFGFGVANFSNPAPPAASINFHYVRYNPASE